MGEDLGRQGLIMLELEKGKKNKKKKREMIIFISLKNICKGSYVI